MSDERICMVGLGYIGLPTAALLASRGREVIGVDVDRHAVDTINDGRVHIVEPDLRDVVRRVVTTGKLRATLTPEPADAFLVAVPTPLDEAREPDLSFVEAAVRSIAPVLVPGNLVVLESTSPVGTTERLAAWLAEERPDLRLPRQSGEVADISVAHCPERVLPGQVLRELVANDRVIGGLTPRCAERAQALYSTFVEGECVITCARTAELCKLTENASRDVGIAFANELSLVCESLGVDVWELIALANRHPRVSILRPGPGVGGHCIAVDPWFIVHSVPERARLIRTAREVNDAKPRHVIEHVIERAERFKAPRIACLGLAFKADTDDLRESPALDIARALAERGAGSLSVVEPNVDALPANLSGHVNVQLVTDVHEALDQADIVLALVAHREFRDVSRERLAGKIVIDTCGLWRVE